MMRAMFLTLVGLTLASGCDDKAASDTKPAGSTAATTTAPSKTSAKAADTAAADTAAADTVAADLPKELAGKLKVGSEKLEDPMLGLFVFRVNKGIKFGNGQMINGRRNWGVIEGNSMVMSVKSHNPSGDDGPGCPTMTDMKAKVKGAKAVIDIKTTTEPNDKGVSLGDEVELYLFEKDGKFGFFGRKVFDHGDDTTTYCCASGEPAAVKNMTGMLGKAQAEELAGICMSLSFTP